MKKFNLHTEPRFSLRVGDIIGIPESFGNLSTSALRRRGVSIGVTSARSHNTEHSFRTLIRDYTYDSMSWFVITQCCYSYSPFVDVQRQSNTSRAMESSLNLGKLFIGFDKAKDRFEPVTCPLDKDELGKKIVSSELSRILAHSVNSATPHAADVCLARVIMNFNDYIKQIGLSGGDYDIMQGSHGKYRECGVGLSMLKSLCFEHGRRFEKCFSKLEYFNKHHRALSLILNISDELRKYENPELTPKVTIHNLIKVLSSIHKLTRYWTTLNINPVVGNSVANYFDSICCEQCEHEIYMPSVALPDNCMVIRPSEAGLAYLEKTMAKELKQQLTGSLKAHIEWTKGVIHPFNDLIGRLSTIINEGKQNGKRNN